MSTLPEFLPPMLSVTGTPKCIDILYQVFCKDFKGTSVLHFGKKIVHNDFIQPGETKEEIFWHVITRDRYDGAPRPFDPPRAQRLPWARPLMEKDRHDDIVIFDYVEGPANKGKRRYIWLRDHDYVVIMQDKKRCFQWLTAFFVDQSKKQDLERRLEEAQKNGDCVK